MYMTHDTMAYARKIQISNPEQNRLLNEHSPRSLVACFFIIIDKSELMNGFVKSMTRSRLEVMVRPAIAMSASY